jgi:hypothetical protein
MLVAKKHMELAEIEPHENISELFANAKTSDEFEYCSTLLRIRGMEDSGWDPLRESDQLANQLMALSNAPLENSLRLRLSLFLYCHLTEMSDVYNITGNMLRVIMGERYVMNPFIAELHASKKSGNYPTSKAARVREWADTAGLETLGVIFDSILVKEVRNAFYHSDYILTNDSFNIWHGRGVHIGNEITHKVPYEWLFPRIQLGINIALAILNTTIVHIQTYKEDKVVKGRFAQDGGCMDIQLTTQEGYGLTGFKTPPDAKFYEGN